jgi:hypothetical protein
MDHRPKKLLDGIVRYYPINPATVRKAVRKAARAIGLPPNQGSQCILRFADLLRFKAFYGLVCVRLGQAIGREKNMVKNAGVCCRGITESRIRDKILRCKPNRNLDKGIKGLFL